MLVEQTHPVYLLSSFTAVFGEQSFHLFCDKVPQMTFLAVLEVVRIFKILPQTRGWRMVFLGRRKYFLTQKLILTRSNDEIVITIVIIIKNFRSLLSFLAAYFLFYLNFIYFYFFVAESWEPTNAHT